MTDIPVYMVENLQITDAAADITSERGASFRGSKNMKVSFLASMTKLSRLKVIHRVLAK